MKRGPWSRIDYEPEDITQAFRHGLRAVGRSGECEISHEELSLTPAHTSPRLGTVGIVLVLPCL